MLAVLRFSSLARKCLAASLLLTAPPFASRPPFGRPRIARHARQRAPRGR